MEIYSIIAIFGITAVIGMYLLSLVLRDKETPKGAAIIHGLFAVIGLVLLINYCLGNETGPLVSSIVLFIAAMEGFLLIYIDITGRKIPKWLSTMHGLTTIAGYAFLLWFAFCQ